MLQLYIYVCIYDFYCLFFPPISWSWCITDLTHNLNDDKYEKNFPQFAMLKEKLTVWTRL